MGRYQDMGEFGDLADYGEWNPLWGFVGGAAVTGAAMTTFKAMGEKHPGLARNAGLYGAGIGLLGSGLAMLSPRTRRFGYLGAAAAVLTALPEVVRTFFLVPRGLGDYDEMGYYESEFAAAPTPALEILSGMQPPVHILQGAQRGMGYTTAEFAGSAGSW